jgi:esterase/lipase superfamily enzyme
VNHVRREQVEIPVDFANPTGSLPSTKVLGDLLYSKQIRCEVDLWGHDVAHDWPWWQRQLVYHLPRFC